MDKNAALCVYLKKYHTGKEKAVPSTELEQLFSVNGRNLRRKICLLYTSDAADEL